MAKNNLKLTSVKIVDHLFEDFKISSIRHKFNLQKLATRAVHLYLTDEEFRKKLHNHTNRNMIITVEKPAQYTIRCS